MHHTKIELRITVPALRRQPKQSPRLGKVLRPALPFVKHRAKVVLRPCMSLLRREHTQSPRLGMVLRSALPSVKFLANPPNKSCD